MMRLKTCQNTKESDEWNTMTELQRQEIQNTLRNTRQYARYTNTMGIRTVNIERKILFLFLNLSFFSLPF